MSETRASRGQAQPRRGRPRAPGLFAYYGGKAKIAPWIVEQMPRHECYVEPFAGGARVLMSKTRSYMEVLNDLDKGVVTAFKVARDHPEALATMLRLTPYSREEHALCSQLARDGYDTSDLEAARAFLVVSQQQMFAQSKPSTWRQPTPPRTPSSRAWDKLPDLVWAVHERLRCVAIECKPALDVIDYTDTAETLYYLDPPYHPKTCDVSGYRCVMSVEEHLALAATLRSLQGMVILSGYMHEDYTDALEGWSYPTRETIASTAAAAGGDYRRTECLWFNPAAWARREAGDMHREYVPSHMKLA